MNILVEHKFDSCQLGPTKCNANQTRADTTRYVMTNEDKHKGFCMLFYAVR